MKSLLIHVWEHKYRGQNKLVELQFVICLYKIYCAS